MSELRSAARYGSGHIFIEARRVFSRGEFEEALRLSQLSFADDGDYALSEPERGLCCLVLGQIAEAAELFNGHLRRTPDDPSTVALLACATEFQGLTLEAVKLYRKVLIASPQSTLANANLGYLLLTRGNVSGSIACLQRIADVGVLAEPAALFFPSFDCGALPSRSGTEADARVSAACLIVGMKLQELGRFAEARRCFEQAIVVFAGNGSAYYRLAIAKKLTPADADFLRSMEEALQREDLLPDDRVEIGLALGKALDDLAEYQQAMARLDEAHAVARDLPGAHFDRAEYRAQIDKRMRVYSKERLEEYKGYRSTSDAPILIVGMIRSGTTLVEQILSSHPDVAAGDELTFWRDRADAYARAGSALPSMHEAAGMAGDYLNLLREIDPNAKRVTDKMPGNFVHLGLVHLLFPNARIVCCRRNPVDTCLSIYMTAFRNTMGYIHSRSDLAFYYREFDRLMSHWRSMIPADRLIEVQYEDLLSDRETVTRRLIDFCGLEWDQACLRPESNRRAVKTASVWQVRQAVYATSQERWRRYEPWLGELRSLLDEGDLSFDLATQEIGENKTSLR